MVTNSGGSSRKAIIMPKLTLDNIQSDVGSDDVVSSVVSGRERLNQTIINNQLQSHRYL